MIALAVSPFYYRQIFFHVEEQLRVRVEAQFAERLPHLQVQVTSARMTADGIEVRGVSIVEPDVSGPQSELVYVDEIFLTCRTSVQELIAGQPEIQCIKLSRPLVRATRRADGSFSTSALFSAKKADKPLPPIVIEGGMLEIFDPLKNPSSTLTLRDIHVTVKPTPSTAPAPQQLAIEGYLTGDHVQRIEIVGNIDPSQSRWTISGTIDGLIICPELRASLPEPLAQSMEVLASSRAPANLSFQVTRDSDDPTPQFEVNGSLSGGRVDHPLLPYPLTDLTARIHADNQGFRIRDVTAHHGQTVWEVTQFDRQGYGANSPCVVRAAGHQVRLDREWRNTLKGAWRTHWINFDPEGDVNLNCTLTFDGTSWKPSLHLTALGNGSFTCHKFPYRLERGQGTLTLSGTTLDINVVAYSGAQPVTLKGTFQNPGPQYTGAIEIWGEKIQFDEKLFAAVIKPKSRETLRALTPRGTFDFHARLWRDPDDPLPRPEIHQHVKVNLNRASFNYDKLPYPLANVQGSVEMRDGQWVTTPQLVGTNDTGVVTLTGRLNTSPAGELLSLKMDARNVPFEEELRDSLPPAQRQIWNTLRPRGSFDLTADVTYDSRIRRPSIDLELVPRDDATSIGTSIEPTAFPYRMEKLGGKIHYHDGHVELHDVQGEHRGTRLTSAGRCDFNPDGSWRLRLERMSVTRVRLAGEDQELVAALPEALRRAVGEIRPTGPINLNGTLEFAKSGPEAPLESGWDVDLYLHQASLQAGPKLENIFGCVRFYGSSRGPRLTSFGELKLDSLTYKNFQFTQILGPLWFDNQHVYLGSLPQAPPQGQRANRVTANIYGGVVAADCHVRLGAVPQYRLIATVSNADLRQFAVENLTNHEQLNGKVLANVDLQGSRGQHTLVGTGDLHLTQANVYELPVMVSLLKIMRAKVPDSTAFTESDVRFQINGQHVLLNQIDLRGDAVSLAGEGELTLDSQTNPIRLELYTTVGSGKMPIIAGMFKEAGKQILKVHVDGTLEHPMTTTEAFPVASQALERLRADTAPQPITPQAAGQPPLYGARR